MTTYRYSRQHISNYNYKTKSKRSFGQRLKNFFTISEEDLKEEPSKEFEKIKLFTLNRGWLFLSILLFIIIINVLVGFNINFLYIRQILGFLFLILIPGLLIMLCFKIRTVKFWEYLVYTIGLSIAFIMFAGLAVNWTLPALGITDKPLSLWPILICFDIFLLGLWLTAIYRNADLKPFDITIPKLDAINRIFFTIPMVFPLLSILGAFLLNNHGPNILTIIMLGGIAVYVIFLVILRKHLNENVWPWAILMMSLALLISFSMRSWFVSGWDISQEQYVFRLAYENKIWSIDNYHDAYNTCLSLSILPTIMNLFLDSNNQLIFKLFFQFIFIFHSLTLFLIFRRYIFSFLSFMCSFLYLGTGYFNAGFTQLIRQEIAFVFFSLMILIIFAKDIELNIKKLLFVIFGVSMIVSHYSTAYIGLALFTLTYIMILLYREYENNKIKKGKIYIYQKSEFYITGILVLLLLLFAFLWMSQLTDTSIGVMYTVKTTFKNIGESFSWDLKQSSVKGALIGGDKVDKYTSEDLNEYINETTSIADSLNKYAPTETKVYSPKIINNEFISPTNRNISLFLSYLYKSLKYLIILSFIFGSFFIYFENIKKVNKEFSFMAIVSVIFMILIILLPFLSKSYNFERLFQQCLIFLSFGSIIFYKKLLKNYRKLFLFFIVFLYIGYYIFNMGILLTLSGGEPLFNLYNLGFNYNTKYSHTYEVSSINWIGNNYEKDIIYMDPYSNLKFYSFGNPLLYHDKKVIPPFMNKHSYVYSNFANKVKIMNYWDARERFNNGVLRFNFPRLFLEGNKNKIYNNGGSDIFK